MRILLSNDDGTNAPGLWAIARELQEAGEVTVVAPDREQSGMGTSVSLHRPVRVSKLASPIPGVDSYSVEGTPADAAIMGINLIMHEKVDLIVAGINQGRNLGNDVYISGTIGAAMQGFFHGIPAFAVSVASYQDVNYLPAARLGGLLAQRIGRGSLPAPVMLNINFPNLPVPQIKGIAVTKLGQQAFGFNVKEWEESGKHNYYWIVRTKPAQETARGTDRWATENHFISITALLERPGAPVITALRDMAPALFEDLKNG